MTTPNDPIDAEFADDDEDWTPPPAPGAQRAGHLPPAPSYADVTGYTEDGRPTLDHVRDKIERRAATAIGSEELAGMIPEVVEAQEAFDKRQEAAKAKLEEIRKSMRADP
ncbi:hypothetical protein [Gordonia iterans]